MYLQSYITLTYQFILWSRVLLENLTGFQLVKKTPEFCGNRRFINAFARARHLSLSGASSIQSIPHIPLPEDPSKYYPPIYVWVSQVVSLPQVSSPELCISLSSLHTCYMPNPTHSTQFNHYCIILHKIVEIQDCTFVGELLQICRYQCME